MGSIAHTSKQTHKHIQTSTQKQFSQLEQNFDVTSIFKHWKCYQLYLFKRMLLNDKLEQISLFVEAAIYNLSVHGLPSSQ